MIAEDGTSNLSFIEVKSDDPYALFKTWLAEAKDSGVIMPEKMTFASSGRDAKVSARSLLMKRLDKDGFVFLTDGRSKKARELEENPNAAMVFVWNYKKGDATILRQVRVEGKVVGLPQQEMQEMYEKEPLFCKIRAHLCHQGETVDWQEHKRNHDRILREVKEDGRLLPMPAHLVILKLVPEVFDFYFSEQDAYIADRALFAKTEDGQSWTHHKIAA